MPLYKTFSGYCCRKMWMSLGSWLLDTSRLRVEGEGLTGHRSLHCWGRYPRGGTLWLGSHGKLSLSAVQQPHTHNLLIPGSKCWVLRAETHAWAQPVNPHPMLRGYPEESHYLSQYLWHTSEGKSGYLPQKGESIPRGNLLTQWLVPTVSLCQLVILPLPVNYLLPWILFRLIC